MGNLCSSEQPQQPASVQKAPDSEDLVVATPKPTPKSKTLHSDFHAKFSRLYDGLSAKYYEMDVDRSTRFWIALVNAQADEKIPGPGVVKNITPKRILDLCPGDVPGQNMSIRFTDLDEDFGDLDAGLLGYLQGALFINSKKLQLDESKQEYFPTPKRGQEVGYAAMPKALPKQIEPWEDLVSDEAMSLVAFYGVGQFYLQSARNPSITGVPGAAYEIDLSYLFNYEVREPFEPYGAIAVYGEDEAIIGIFWSLKQEFVKPGDAAWEHVKYVFKTTLFTSATLKEHLALVHWQTANPLVFATRQSFEADKPMHRLLKQHTFRTVLINLGSKDLLLPKYGVAYRVFAFSKNVWYRAVHDIVAFNKYETFADFVAKKNLPETLIKKLPYFQDGFELYAIIRKYVAAYLGVYYETDADVLGDQDMLDYWSHYDRMPMWPSYGLPALSLETLIDQVAYSIFGVTAQHEMVGSLVEYIVNPAGCGAKITPNKAEADVQSFFQTLSLIALTGEYMSFFLLCIVQCPSLVL